MNVILLSKREAAAVAASLAQAVEDGREVRVAVDGGFKFKIGGGMWTPPLGKDGSG